MLESSRLRLAIVCNSIPPYRVQVHQRIVREMPEVHLFTIRTHEEEARWPEVPPAELNVVAFGEGIPCSEHGAPRHAWREWGKGGRIVQWLKEHSVGAVVLLGYNDPGRVRILRWCRRRRIPCFIWGDSNIRDEQAKNIKGLKAVVKRIIVGGILRWCTGVLTCGERGKAFFARYGVDEQRMFLFPNEPDYKLFANVPAAKIAEVHERLQLSRERRRMVYSGRLSPEKRVDLLIDAFTRIAEERSGWDLIILGDGALRAALEARVPTHLKQRVLWLGHQSDTATVAAIYRASDMLVLPSDREPWALVINEAVAAGMAIVSSDVPGAAAELVRDGVNGRIFPASDLAALTAALLDVTAQDRIDRFKEASPGILEDWRAKADPIAGLRKALRFGGATATS